MAIVTWFLLRENRDSSGDPGIRLPSQVQARTATAPISEASTTFPLRIRYIQSPTKSAIGTVQAIVKTPQELPRIRRRAPSGIGYTPGAAAVPNPAGDSRSKSSWTV